MDRREFIAALGSAALLAGAGGLSGCARALDWSSQGSGAARKAMEGQISGSATGAAPGAAPETTASTSKKGEVLVKRPDLVVAKAGTPDVNVAAAIAGLGGIERFVKRGAKVAIKPNVLTGREPEYGVTTDPILMGALVKMCLDAGASEVVVFDHSTSEPSTAFQVSGIESAVQAAGGQVKYLTDRNYQNTSIPKGRLLTSWPLVSDVFDADAFINVPVAKTHSLAGLTMAMKNLMGIMGGMRGVMHVDFDQKIVDLNTLVKPHLVVLDATRTLWRNGPTGGSLSDVRRTDTVIAGTSQVSVDAFGTTLFGMKPTDLGYLVKARDQGLGEIDLAKLDIARVRA